MLLVLQRTVSIDGSSEHPKHMLKNMCRKYSQFYAENIFLSTLMEHEISTAHKN